MKKIIKISSIIFLGITFVSCSNMTVGFEEDSVLYDGPIIDTRDNVVIEKKKIINVKEANKKKIVTNPKIIPVKYINNKTIIKDKKIPIEKIDETSFYYERDDE